MTSTSRRAKGGGWAVLPLGLVVLTPALYVASMGSVATFLDDWHDLDSNYAIYRPVFQTLST
jgi:hypothetical protein